MLTNIDCNKEMISRPFVVFLATLALILSISATATASDVLRSPSGSIQIKFVEGYQLGFDLCMDSNHVLEVRELNIYIDDEGYGSPIDKVKPKITSVSKPVEVKETYKRFVPHSEASNHYYEYQVNLESANGNSWVIDLRLFDDGAAYRLRVPLSGEHHVSGDYAAWLFEESSTVWQQNANNRSYEDEYIPYKISDLMRGYRFMIPATVVLPEERGYVLVTEANLSEYGDLALEASHGNAFRHVFHDDSEGWKHDGEVITPWRTIIASKDLNGLVNSDIVANLCPEPSDALKEADWIKPGRCLWHWLTTGHPKVKDQKAWIDGASDLGWEYYLIDDGWRDWDGGGGAAWKIMTDLVKYAEDRDVSLWAWVHSKYLLTHEDRVTYFNRAKKAGLVGLKIDFPRPANRDWVNWYNETLKDAGEAELLINFHGSVKPTGLERTWPHELTREAIRGREQGKLPASHDTALPFIRFVQGHADYTPTLFVEDALRGSTYAHELAMAIVYSSPLLCMGGCHDDYLESEALEVLKALPSTWEETIVLPNSEMGELCAFARRNGDDWFIGVIGGAKGTTVQFPTDFLGTGNYQCLELADNPDNKASFVTNSKALLAGETITATMSDDGGYVALIRPAQIKGQ